jgi:hypothetical protein
MLQLAHRLLKLIYRTQEKDHNTHYIRSRYIMRQTTLCTGQILLQLGIPFAESSAREYTAAAVPQSTRRSVALQHTGVLLAATRQCPAFLHHQDNEELRKERDLNTGISQALVSFNQTLLSVNVTANQRRSGSSKVGNTVNAAQESKFGLMLGESECGAIRKYALLATGFALQHSVQEFLEGSQRNREKTHS